MSIWNALAGGTVGFNIENSGGFNGASHMTRTWSASPTNNQIYTLSFWVKKPLNTQFQEILRVDQSAGNLALFRFTDLDQILILHQVASVNIVQYISTRLFRDVSSWYHIVWTVDATLATEHNRVYVNGEELTIWSTKTQPAGTYTPFINRANLTHFISRNPLSATLFISGYLADVNFIDGQVIDPSEFGQFDNNGIWVPKRYVGTYGDDGCLLEFQNSGAQGEDTSGNGNDFTNFGVTQRSDTPNNNVSTFNVNHKDVNNQVSNAAIVSTRLAAGWGSTLTTLGFTTGKWYWEIRASSLATEGLIGFGIALEQYDGITWIGQNTLGYGAFFNAANTNLDLWHNNVMIDAVNVGDNLAVNDIVMMAYDADTGDLWMGLNGTWFVSGDPAAGTNQTFTGIFPGESSYRIPGISLNSNGTATVWFADPALQSHPIPDGFLPLSSANLPEPDIEKPSDYFETLLWTGDGVSPRDISGLDFSPDLVIVKSRSLSAVSSNNIVGDTYRGGNASLFTNLTNVEQVNSNGYISGFNPDGFEVSVGPTDFRNTNQSGETYIGRCWQEGALPGFDIILYTGTGVNRTVSHNLGVIPQMIIVKNRDDLSSWNVYHEWVSSTPQNSYLLLNTTNVLASDIGRWNNTAPTSTEFTVGTITAVNGASDLLVAYLFAPVAGFSKMGYYIGNGSAEGPSVYTGFRPKYLLIKNTSVATSWLILESDREIEITGGNPMQRFLLADSDQIESTSTGVVIDFLANGFKIRATGGANNTNGNRYVYLAFAEHPFNYGKAF